MKKELKKLRQVKTQKGTQIGALKKLKILAF